MDILIFQTFKDILTSTDPSPSNKAKLIRLFQVILDNALENEKIHFTSLFSKLAFLGVRYQLAGPLMHQLHVLRKRIENPSDHLMEKDLQLLVYLIPHLYAEVTNENIPPDVNEIIPKDSGIPAKSREILKFIPHAKLYCTAIDVESELIYGYLDLEESVEDSVKVRFNIADRNERFTGNILEIQDNLPALIELIEIEITPEEEYHPTAFVIEPDFLVDVTSIANCFEHNGTKTIGYIFRKFLPVSQSKYLIMGNVANYFLDRIIGKPDISFNAILQEVFQLDPLGFAKLGDTETKEFVNNMKKHFFNIKNSVNSEFPKEKIDPESSYLEPSFMSASYGIQGRLDLLHMDNEYTSIIELKSGSIYKPNVYGLKNDHYVQTLLYDLLIRSTFPGKKPRNYILYSKESEKTLRIAPRIAAQQKEALRLRNDLLKIENNLCNPEATRTLLRSVNVRNYEHVRGFEADNIARFERMLNNLSEIEHEYFNHFVNFIALEHKLAKIGEYGQDKSNGLAGIWLDSIEEKVEQFNIITNLIIKSNKTSEEEALLTLKHSETTNKLSNFRKGDIVILYPLNGRNDSALKNQIFKCSVLDYVNDEITIRFRSQQKNQEIFDKNKFWAIEHDVMDSSFHNMYRQLFEWAEAPKSKRDLLLGITAPKPLGSKPLSPYESLTSDQNALLQKMINNQDYFLVWGPPGTGKTSRIISHYIKYILDETSENLYVLAYTNRAVDEICEAIETLGQDYSDQYLRIGSRYGTDPKFSNKLLNSQIKNINSRKVLKESIQKHRIVVATLASIYSKEIIFELIPATKVIIDEASQILEPNIIGLLTKFKQFILVGDHRQLPAVVVQDKKFSQVDHEGLRSINLEDRRDSLFERLYRLAQNNSWHHAWGQLTQQGRMHVDIMKFPNDNFYENNLQTLPQLDRLSENLNCTIDHINKSRLLFNNITVPVEERFSKTNSAEVIAAIEAVLLFRQAGYPLEEIGIITPFRAQIAAIKDKLLSISSEYQSITVDTVERFQGGARRVIIISFCCNSPIQFRSMISISHEGIDRKLNVALTRAKEHVLLLGDEKILRLNPIYNELIDGCMPWKD